MVFLTIEKNVLFLKKWQFKNLGYINYYREGDGICDLFWDKQDPNLQVLSVWVDWCWCSCCILWTVVYTALGNHKLLIVL